MTDTPGSRSDSAPTPRTDEAAKKALATLDGDYPFAFGHLQGFAEMLEREIDTLTLRLRIQQQNNEMLSGENAQLAAASRSEQQFREYGTLHRPRRGDIYFVQKEEVEDFPVHESKTVYVLCERPEQQGGKK